MSRRRNETEEEIPHKKAEPAVVVPAALYEIVALSLRDCGTAPCTGQSHYIVADKDKHKVTLLHPFTLTKFTVPNDMFLSSLEEADWKPTPEKVVKLLEDKSALFVSLNRQVPAILKEIIAHFRKLA